MAAIVKLNIAGFRALRKSPDVVEDLNERALRIREACGDGYVINVSPSKNRARVTIFPDTPAAVADNARNLTLIRNLDKGR